MNQRIVQIQSVGKIMQASAKRRKVRFLGSGQTKGLMKWTLEIHNYGLTNMFKRI